jgi:hypothetical protein
MSIRQDVFMTSPVDPPDDSDRTPADFCAEIDRTGGPRLTAAEPRRLAAGSNHDEFIANLPR